MKQRLSGRNTLVLWLAMIITLLLFASVGYYLIFWMPAHQNRQQAEAALADCRTQVTASRWDEAERSCSDAVVRAPDDLAAEARTLLQNAQAGWLDYYYTRGVHFWDAGDPVRAQVEIDKVFAKDPGYRDVAVLRRQVQEALAEMGIPVESPTASATPSATPATAVTPDTAATATAWAIDVEAAVQSTLEAQAEETRQAVMIAATLTALAPTFTPTPTPTRNAPATSTPVPRRTATPTPNHTATARIRATQTAEASNTLPWEVEVLMAEWDRIHHEVDRSLVTTELSSVLAEAALSQQMRTIDQLRSTNCYWIFTDLSPAIIRGWRRVSSTEMIVDVRKHWDGKLYCNGQLSTSESFNTPFNARYIIKKTDRWRITVKTEIDDNEVMWGPQR